MYNDFSFEDSIRRDNGTMGKIYPIMAFTAALIFVFFLNAIPIIVYGKNIIFFTGMISFGLLYLVYRSCKKLKFEYELEIVNDIFSITKVIDQKKRIELCEFSLRDCEHIGPVTEERFPDDKIKGEFDYNCTSRRKFELSENTWYALVNSDGFSYVVIFEFRKPMYKIFRRFAPRNVFIMPIPSEDDSDDI